MADYAKFLFDAFAAPGQAVSERRQEVRGNMENDRNYARALGLDDWRKQTDERDFNYRGQRDQVGDSQWSQEFGANNSFRNRSLSLQEQRLAQDAAGAESYGLTPVWGTDAQGKPALIQLGKGGQPIQPQLPEGFQIARDPIKMDAGTHFVLLDPQTRQQIGTIPKDVAGEAAAAADGKALSEARTSLPKALGQAENMLTTIKSVRDDPYRSRGTGLSSVGNIVPGTGGYDFARKVDQLKGQAFLQAFESLKGGGVITNIEGDKATNAIARLDTAQSEEAFNAALKDLEDVVTVGMQRSQQRAGGQPQPQQPGSDGWQTMSNGVKMRQVR